jgi:type I restriction enzyme R subunit
VRAGWDLDSQIREEVSFTAGRIIVRGKLVTRGKAKRADYILYYKPNIPIAVIEAKDNTHSVGDGMQQALDYAETLEIPFVFSSNGDGFLSSRPHRPEPPRSNATSRWKLPLTGELWAAYRAWKGLAPAEEEIVLQDYHDDGSGKTPRYYQTNAINKPPSKPSPRVRTASCWSWPPAPARPTPPSRSSGACGRQAARSASCSSPTATFWSTRPWSTTSAPSAGPWPSSPPRPRPSNVTTEHREPTTAVTKDRRRIDTSYEIYLGLYQAITGPEEHKKLYREFSPDFFDLIVIDECHRGSAAEDSAWREILEYFASATQIGLTATPKETEYVSNIHYFGEPVATYSLKQGIRDGFLAPYKVVKVHLDVDMEGYRPRMGETDRHGYEIEDRIYNQKDFDRNLVIDERTKRVAARVSEFLKRSGDRFQKTIVFCVDTEHAARMRQAFINENPDLVQQHSRYVMRITGDDAEGCAEIGRFIDPEATTPVSSPPRACSPPAWMPRPAA